MLELFALGSELFNEKLRSGAVSSQAVNMGEKRKAKDGRSDLEQRPPKKARPEKPHDDRKKLLFTPRPDWHAAELPSLAQVDVKTLPPQHTVDVLLNYATTLLEAENAAYNASNSDSSHKFLSTIMSSGTLEDKVSALTLLVQESPLHTIKAFENLLGLSKKKSRNQALMALAAMKDLLDQGVVLPANRKLKAFGKQTGLLCALQGKNARWQSGEPLPGGLDKMHLLVWAYEDWLKRTYFSMLQILESWLGDEVTYSRSRSLTYIYELLQSKPEQEENLLRLLVNKLGDTDRKIASRASYLLLQLETQHPAMKTVITNSVEADCLFRPGQSLHARYYAIITLNQTILTQKEEAVANKLLDVYFSLFIQLLKPASSDVVPANGKPGQGGGGHPGKKAAQKQRAAEKAADKAVESEGQLREKMMAQVLTGVNRAFPFADTNDPTFEAHMDTLFRVTHSANFNTAIQALMLIQQIASTKHYGAERFYRTLYESLLDPRLATSSKQVMYLNLLYRSLKADLDAKRVQAFVKRLLQIITMHEPPFVCGVLYLVSELEGTFPSIRNMTTEPEVGDEDEEERFVDAPEDSKGAASDAPHNQTAPNRKAYDPKKRDPSHANAGQSCLWDILPFLQHFHPSVSIFAESLLFDKQMPAKPDPATLTLMHFLDRFVYRNAKTKERASHGSSIMQPMAGSASRADMLVRPGQEAGVGANVNSEAFWNKKLEDVKAEDVFFHAYFNQAGNKKRRAPKKEAKADVQDEDDSDAGEDEIWEAIAKSKPEVEGPDEDDDLSLGDLESGYSDDGGSEAGIDLGGGAEDREAGIDLGGEGDADTDDEDMEGMPELESDEGDAMFDDDAEVPFDIEDEAEEPATDDKAARNKNKRKEKKKLKALPTFASAEDYAKLLADEPDDV